MAQAPGIESANSGRILRTDSRAGGQRGLLLFFNFADSCHSRDLVRVGSRDEFGCIHPPEEADVLQLPAVQFRQPLIQKR